MIQTVAVGTDGTGTADVAFSAALDLAERFGAKLLVLSAYDGDAAVNATATLASAPLEAQWANHPADQVEGILAASERLARERGLDCQTASADGDPADVLVTLAERYNADVLVIGNKGMHRRLLGSVPNTVTHKAPCSVYVVKTT